MLKQITLFLTIIFLSQALDVVDDYDIESYVGDWFEVARSPWIDTTAQKNGFCTRARYKLLENGQISVKNVQRDGSVTGQVSGVTGHAEIPNPDEKAKLKVFFFDIQGGDYWILKLGPKVNDKYDWAIVSEPEMLYMWVLSRDPQRYRDEYEDYVREEVYRLGFTSILNKYVPKYFDGCIPYDD